MRKKESTDGIILKEDHLKVVLKLRRKILRNYFIFAVFIIIVSLIPLYSEYSRSLILQHSKTVKDELKILNLKYSLLQLLRNKPLTIGQALVVADVIIEQGSRSEVPVNLILSVISVESDFNPNAVSNKGARGLMQVMPTIFKQYVEEQKLEKEVYDPALNIRVAIMHLGDLYNGHKDWENALRVYYSGSLRTNKDVDRYVRIVLKRTDDLDKGTKN